jgi:hypothetical protein
MTEDFFRSKKGLIAANNSAQSSLVPNALTIGTTIVNTNAITLGANVVLDISKLFLGNSTVNTVITSTSITTFVGGFSILTAQGSTGTDGQVLTSNGTTISWASPGTSNPPGSNTEIIFNDQGTFGTHVGITYNKNLLQLNLGNSTVNSTANATLIKVANSTATANLTVAGLTVGSSLVSPTAIGVGANVFINSTLFFAGNSTINAIVNSSTVWVQTATTNTFMGTGMVASGNSSIVTTLTPGGVTTGANIVLGQSGLQLGNSTINTFANSILVKVHNTTGSANLSASQLVIGTSIVNSTLVAVGNSVLNTTAIFLGNSTITATANSTRIHVGNSTINVSLTAAAITISNSTFNTIANTSTVKTAIIETAVLVANASVGSDGQYLTSNGSTIYWSSAGSGFTSGTRMLFQQTSAPTGWTKSVTHNDKALRVVSGTVSSGGTHGFSTVFGKTATDNHTLTIAQMPSHTHTMTGKNSSGSGPIIQTASAATGATIEGLTTEAAGSGSGHSHGMDIRVQYVDVIIAVKD